MTTKKEEAKTRYVRNNYTAQFKEQVLERADRGSQYCPSSYQKLFRKHHLVCSMNKKGDCYDNAAMESWNHSFKAAAIHGEHLKTLSDAKFRVFE